MELGLPATVAYLVPLLGHSVLLLQAELDPALGWVPAAADPGLEG